MADGFPAQAEAHHEQRRPRRRGRRALVVLLVVLLVLAGLFVLADRIAVGVAERVIAEQVDQEIARQDVRASAPEVTVGGFPFLTQVVGGRYDSIKVLLRDVQGPAQGRAADVRLPELTVDARDVSASLDTLRSGQGEVTAETVEGNGIITYDSVVRLIDRPGVTLREEGGRLALAAPVRVPLLDEEVTVRGIADLTVQQGEVVISFAELTADDLPNNPGVRSFISNFAQQLSVRVPLPPLPFELELRAVRALPEGLAVSATARNVALSQLG